MKYSPISLALTLCCLAVQASTLDELDLESLMAADLQSTSAMKRAQSVQQTAASVYVLTQQELAQSGVDSIPDALALVPGVQVRRIDQNQWAISIRATGGRFSSKLLVMIDGQSVYNPVFAGVFWESMNLPIYDIERIEVIRGPGGLLWGSNATHGVVNIITKHSIDTTTTYAEASLSDGSNTHLGARVGQELSRDASYRIYADYRNQSSLDDSVEGSAYDGGIYKSVGSRFDYNPEDDLSWMAQLEWNQLKVGQQIALPSVTLSTALNEPIPELYSRHQLRFVTRVEQAMSSRASQSLQLAYLKGKGRQSYANESFSHYDLDYQMNLELSLGQLDWGLNYRYNNLPLLNSSYLQSNTGIDSTEQYGLFLQYQAPLFNDEWGLTLGNKSEHNSLTNWENQPSVRLLWQPTNEQAAWLAWSKGVQLPSLGFYDYNIQTSSVPINALLETPSPELSQFQLGSLYQGNASVDSEKTTSQELGYRWSATEWKFDLSIFRSESENILTYDPHVPEGAIAEALALFSQGQIEEAGALLQANPLVLLLRSNGQLTTHGMELGLHFQLTEEVNIELGASYSNYEFDTPAGSIESQPTTASTRQLFLKSRYQPTERHSLYLQFRYEDGEAYETDDLRILDINWLWQLSPQLALSVRGKNLLADDQLQFGHSRDSFTQASYHRPELALQLSYQL